MKTSEYLRSLPDSEVMDPVSPGVLLNTLKRVRGFPDASIHDIQRERSWRNHLARGQSAFSHVLVRVEEALGLQDRALTSLYWGIKDSTAPGESAIQAIAEASGISLSTLLETYQKVTPKEVEKPKAKKHQPKIRKEPKTETPPSTKKNYISEEDVQGMRLQYVDGQKVSDIARYFSRDSKLVSLIVRNERHQNSPYLSLGVLDPRRYDREEILSLLGR